MVRDGAAQGDDVRVGDHRHLPGRQEPGHRVRAAPPLHGRDRRRVPCLGDPARAGPAGSANAIGSAARALGAEIRTEAPVANVIVKDGRAVGRRARIGRGDRTPTSILSSLDARQTFLDLLEPGSLDPAFEDEVRRFKFRGSSGKVNLAVDRLPDFTCLPGVGEHLRGAISFSPSIDEMETRLRRREVRPVQPQAVHRHDHPDPGRPVDGAARQARHQLLRPVRAVQAGARARDWDDQREAFGDAVIDRIAEFAPNIRDIILHRNVQTPLDIERTTGLTEGNIFQGELSLEQLFFNRPVPGYARFRTPVRDLWLCGSATHPGGGIMGANGRIAALEVLRARGRKAA